MESYRVPGKRSHRAARVARRILAYNLADFLRAFAGAPAPGGFVSDPAAAGTMLLGCWTDATYSGEPGHDERGTAEESRGAGRAGLRAAAAGRAGGLAGAAQRRQPRGPARAHPGAGRRAGRVSPATAPNTLHPITPADSGNWCNHGTQKPRNFRGFLTSACI